MAVVGAAIWLRPICMLLLLLLCWCELEELCADSEVGDGCRPDTHGHIGNGQVL